MQPKAEDVILTSLGFLGFGLGLYRAIGEAKHDEVSAALLGSGVASIAIGTYSIAADALTDPGGAEVIQP